MKKDRTHNALFVHIRVIACLCVLAFPVAVNAFTIERVSLETAANDFMLSPAKVEISASPDDIVTRTISVTNRTDQAMRFVVSVEDFVGSNEKDSDVVLLGDDEGAYSLRNFIEPEVGHFTLASGERIMFDVSVTPPPGFSGGGLYGAVIVASDPDDDTAEATGGARVVSRLASLFFVRVPGDTLESGHILDFRISGPRQVFSDRGPFVFEVLFENDGSVHLVPYGVIEIRNMFGAVVAELPIDPYFALPDSTRFREIVWDAAPLFGRYEATLLLNRGYDDHVDERQVTFLVLPSKIVGGAFFTFVLLIVLLLLWYVRTRAEMRRKQL